MLTASPITPSAQASLKPTAGSSGAASSAASSSVFAHYQIIRRNGAVVPFEPSKIAVAMMKAFLAVHGTQGAASASVREMVDELTQAVTRALMRSRPGGGTFHIEDVQDQVELGLMRGGHHEVARAYVLYRERRTQERAHQAVAAQPAEPVLHVVDNGERRPLDLPRLRACCDEACAGLGAASAASLSASASMPHSRSAPMQAISPASRFPLSTVDTYRGNRGSRVLVSYQL